MEHFFWKDYKRECFKTYADLICELNETKTYCRYAISANPYDLFKTIILAIINEDEIELLDSDLSEEELLAIGVSRDKLQTFAYENDYLDKITEEVLFEKVLLPSSKFAMTLYTSGTTGAPKKIKHSLYTLTRTSRKKDLFSKDVWAMVYNPTHYAAQQVFFQALINKNTIVYLFDTDRTKLEEIICAEQITRISATPTFYKNVFPFFRNQMDTVRTVTCGGEKFNANLEQSIMKYFPNAKVKNIYASTEAGSLFSSNGDTFDIPNDINDKVRISEQGELMIHKSLLGESSDYEFEGEFYNTKDLVEKTTEVSFRFISRNSDFINVGGYRVNALEVEGIIQELSFVQDVAVSGRKNSVTGNLIVASVVKNDDNLDDKALIDQISQHCKSKLQAWKVPRIIKIIDEIEKTRTGKKVRA